MCLYLFKFRGRGDLFEEGFGGDAGAYVGGICSAFVGAEGM
jgi:hypothetical protein